MSKELKISEKDLLAKDDKYLSKALTRCFGVIAESGEGPYLSTVDGEKYLDLTCGIGVTQLGHCHPEVTIAAQKQIETLLHISCVTHHTKNIELAEKLISILPQNIDNVFFCNSGAEAVEGAIKLSRKANPGRPNILSFSRGFHGRTMGAISVSASKVGMRKDYFPLVPGVYFVDYPIKPDFDYIFDDIKNIFKLQAPGDSFSGVIIEPVLGEGGYIPCPPDFMKKLRQICDEHGIFLIADEVQSGFGRTGKWFGVEHTDTLPDIMTMAKGIANGFPMGAFASSKKIMDKMLVGTHGSTFGGNPVACAAALKTIEVIEREKILPYVSKTGEELMSNMKSELEGHADIRGRGFMIGIELENKEKADQVIKDCFKNEKILLLPCSPDLNTIRLIPPLNIDKDLLFSATNKIISVIKKG